MSEPSHPVLIGCSGWSYPDWEGVFYPAGMPAGDYLEWYADRFAIGRRSLADRVGLGHGVLSASMQKLDGRWTR